MQAVKNSNQVSRPSQQDMLPAEECRSESAVLTLTMTAVVLNLPAGEADWLYPRVPIDALPDNVLLETFEFYLGKDAADLIDDEYNYDGWQTLVHVCRRWRCVVFASPRRLDLKLHCTRRRSVTSKTLNIWPELPIVVYVKHTESEEDVANIITSLRQHNRVCKIYYEQFIDSLLEEFAAIDEPFLALTSLKLFSVGKNVPVLPDSFLGGSAPLLQSLHLHGIPYPSIGNLLSSTTNLVRLSLWRIPHSGYLSPETIVPCLSMLPQLKSLSLGSQYPRSRAHRAIQNLPLLTRVVFPNLAFLEYSGNVEYLEDVLSQIESPMLNESHFWFFNQLIFDTPQLGHFIRRTEAFMTVHTARVEFSGLSVGLTLSGREEKANNDREALQMEITCKPLDWQLSALAQILDPFLSSLATLESLEVVVFRKDWPGEIEVVQWRECLQPFTSVKDMTLEFEDSIQLIFPALQELAVQRATEVLPGLQNIFLRTDWQPSGPVKEAIKQFIAARQLYGRPVTVHYQATESEE